MTKHQMVHAEVPIQNMELMISDMTKEEIDAYVADNLARCLADEIIKNKVFDLEQLPGYDEWSTRFRLSLVVMRPDDYHKLCGAIFGNDFNIIEDGEVIPLINLV
jgi:hypothetical protein